MKKKLEADLVSIAHRILQLKNKSDLNQLYLETQKLYEKISLLRFVDAHFGDSKPTIGQDEVEQQIEAIFEASETKTASDSTLIAGFEEAQLPQNETPVLEETEAAATASNEAEQENKAIFIPDFELEKEDEPAAEAPKPAAVQISFEEILGGNFNDDLFVKVETNLFETPTTEKEKATAPTPALDKMEFLEQTKDEPKKTTLNEKLIKGIHIDLNDRIAFTKHLFGNNPEDYNRVLNQLITFDTFYETRDFIRDMVKPDYNNWQGKEEYEERFMEIIEKKFL